MEFKLTKYLSNPNNRKVNCGRRCFVIFRFFFINSLELNSESYAAAVQGRIYIPKLFPFLKQQAQQQKKQNEKLLYSINVCSGTTGTAQTFTKYVLTMPYCITILPFLQAVELILNLFIFSTTVTQNCSRKETRIESILVCNTTNIICLLFLISLKCLSLLTRQNQSLFL